MRLGLGQGAMHTGIMIMGGKTDRGHIWAFRHFAS
jgi:hypothetical protein